MTSPITSGSRLAQSPNGGAPLVPGNPGNSGGKPGRSGRKSIAFVAKCEGLAGSVVLPKVEKYLKSKGDDAPADPAWRWCAEFVARYVPVEGGVGGQVLFVRFVQE